MRRPRAQAAAAAERASHDAPPWVLDALGADASGLRKLPWGFTNESWFGTAPDGARHVATKMSSLSAAAALVGRGAEMVRRLASAGLTTPLPIPNRSEPGNGVVVTTWLEGTPGMALLGEPGGAELVGSTLGAVWRALAGVDPGGMELDDLWARPVELERRAGDWLHSVRAELGEPAAEQVATRLDGLANLLRGRPASFVHGDLVPANVLLRDGRLPALLDFEASRIGDSLLDAAWFSWIVGYHHPDIHGTAWAAFSDAAGLRVSDRPVRALLARLPVVRILEILSEDALSPESHARWLAQLRAASLSDRAGPAPGRG